MFSLLQDTIRRARAGWHHLLGRLWFRLGRLNRARRRFEAVLVHRGDDFSAYVHLGMIAWAQGDYAGWQREFEHARRAAPERHDRLRGRPPAPPTPRPPFGEAGERATWRTAASTRARPVRLGDEEDVSPGAAWPGWGAAGVGPGHSDAPCGSSDDFASDEERRRFAAAPPITREEIALSDFDDLTGRLGKL